MRTLEYIEQLQPKWKETNRTQDGLVEQLGDAQKKISQLEDSLSSARKKLEDEMVRRRRAEEDIKNYVRIIYTVLRPYGFIYLVGNMPLQKL